MDNRLHLKQKNNLNNKTQGQWLPSHSSEKTGSVSALRGLNWLFQSDA